MADKKKQDERHSAILQEMLKLPENRVCADCPEKGFSFILIIYSSIFNYYLSILFLFLF